MEIFVSEIKSQLEWSAIYNNVRAEMTQNQQPNSGHAPLTPRDCGAVGNEIEQSQYKRLRGRSRSQPTKTIENTKDNAKVDWQPISVIQPRTAIYPQNMLRCTPSYDSAAVQLADLVCCYVYKVLRNFDVFGVFEQSNSSEQCPALGRRARSSSLRTASSSASTASTSEPTTSLPWQSIYREANRSREHSETPPLSAYDVKYESESALQSEKKQSRHKQWTPPATPREFEYAPIQVVECNDPIRLSSNVLLFRRYVLKILEHARLCIPFVLIGLIYLKRLMRSDPKIKLYEGSEFRIFGVALLLACKIYDDHRTSNDFFARISGLKLSELNIMEIEFMSMLNCNLLVSSKKYFQNVFRLQNISDTIWDRKIELKSRSTSDLLTFHLQTQWTSF